MNKSIPPPHGIAPCEGGKLRWSYTLNLWRQPVMLYTAKAGAKSGITSIYERSIEMAKKKNSKNIPLPILILICATLLFAMYATQVKFCTKCGSGVVSGARFCGKCGNRL